MFVFLALKIQMGHGVREKLADCWATVDQLYTPFMALCWNETYLHIHSYLHFTDNRNEPEMTDECFDGLWKIRDLFEILNGTFSKFYNHSKTLPTGKVFVSFKGRAIFSQYIPKKCKHFGIKISDFVARLDTCMTWKYTWGRIVHGTVCKNNSCDSDRTDEEGRRTWVQIIHGNGKEKDMLLWGCKAEQERYATRPSTQDVKIEMGRLLHKDQGWVDSSTVV